MGAARKAARLKQHARAPPPQVDSADDLKQIADAETTVLQGICSHLPKAKQRAPRRQGL